MIIKSLDDLEVFHEACTAADAVSALLRRDGFRHDETLREQLAASSDRIASHISEGFGLPTDRHFAYFLSIARGSCNEVRTHLTIAKGRRYITETECADTCARYISIGKRLTRLIQHLRKEDRKQRG